MANNPIQFDPSGASSQAVGDVCVPNISPKERQLRKKFAVQQFLFTLAVLAVLVYLDVNPLWRLLLYVMFSAATTSYIQALDKT